MEDDLAFDFEGALQGTSPRAAQQVQIVHVRDCTWQSRLCFRTNKAFRP